MNCLLSFRGLVHLTLSAIFCVVLSHSYAYADIHRLFWEPSASSGNKAAGRALSFDVSYDTDTLTLQWIVNFQEQSGVKPNGFRLALNGTGDNPKGHNGELAFFYLDASDLDNPVLTVYGYNGINGHSWKDGSNESGTQDPDKILSTRLDDSFVIELIARDEADGTRTLGFVIDSTLIQNHTPLYPDPGGEPWQGAQFTSIVGMWFHPVAGLTTSYETSGTCEGYLTSFWYEKIGWYDTRDQTTPSCTSTSVSTLAEVGTPFNVSFQGFDPQDDPLTVEVTGLPDGATLTPAATTNGTGLDAVFDWTPAPTQQGETHTIEVKFTEPNGSFAICPFTVTTPPNEGPSCDASGGSAQYTNLDCSEELTSVQLDGSNSFDPDGLPAPLTYEWSTDCPKGQFDDNASATPVLTFMSENSDGTPVSCTAFLTVFDGSDTETCDAAVSVKGCTRDCEGTINGAAVFDVCGQCEGNSVSCLCEDANFTEQINSLDSGTNRLSGFARKLGSKLRKLRGGKPTKREKALVKKADDLHLQGWFDINQVPPIITQCTGDIAICVAVDHSDFIESYRQVSNDITNIVTQLSKKYKKLLKKAGFSPRQVKKKSNKLLDKAVTQNEANQAQADTLPSSTAQCVS